MSEFTFSKLVPGGNPTVLLHDPSSVEPGSLAPIAAKILSPMHLQAEQVGALYSARGHEWFHSSGSVELLPHLAMMGGEFCVNAVRSAAFCLARQGWLAPLQLDSAPVPARGGRLTVSGSDCPVRVLVAGSDDKLEKILRSDLNIDAIEAVPSRPANKKDLPDLNPLFCAAEVPCPPLAKACIPLHKGASLVTMPGISHLLVDARIHPLPDIESHAWKTESAAWRTLCGMSELPACGVVWYTRDGNSYSIWPAVTVKATETELMESACGSASFAVALLHAGQQWGSGQIEVLQPSGKILTVTFGEKKGENSPASAWISGPVFLVAEGKIHV